MTIYSGFMSLTRCPQRSDITVAVGHFFIVIEYRHDYEYVTVRDDRHRQNESEAQHVDVERAVRVCFSHVVPRTRRLEAFQHVLGPTENRRQSDRQAVYPNEHAHLKIG